MRTQKSETTIMQDEQVRFTPVQQRMLAVLSDGKPHSREALLECLQDDQCSAKGHLAHLTAIRKILRRRSEDIICVYNCRRPFWQHVRLLASAYDGYQ
jgi:hypothetical protein